MGLKALRVGDVIDGQMIVQTHPHGVSWAETDKPDSISLACRFGWHTWGAWKQYSVTYVANFLVSEGQGKRQWRNCAYCSKQQDEQV